MGMEEERARKGRARRDMEGKGWEGKKGKKRKVMGKERKN